MDCRIYNPSAVVRGGGYMYLQIILEMRSEKIDFIEL